MAGTTPSKVYIKGLGMFRVFGEESRKLTWNEDSVPAVPGEFAVARPIRLSTASAGITASTRHAGTRTPTGVADVTNGDTSRDDIIGAGPQLTTVALTATPDGSVGPTNPGTAANDAANGTNAWTNPNNAKTTDATYATVTASGITQGLRLTNFGFAVPATALIRGIAVLLNRSKLMAAADTGVTAPTTGADDSSVGTQAWTNPGNILASDNAWASAATGASATAVVTHALKATGFGFTVPTTAQILGYVASIERHETAGTLTMASGPRPPSTLVDDATVGTGAWGGIADAALENGAVALASSQTHYIKATNFFLSVPGGKTIVGIGLRVKWDGIYGGIGPTDASVKLVKGGVISGADRADGRALPLTTPGGGLAWSGYGGSTDMWGLALTQADVTGATFGVAISAGHPGQTSVQIDAIELTVYYTDAADVVDSQVAIVRADGSFGATNKAVAGAWPGADAAQSYGGAADTWGETLQPADVNGAAFGVMLAAALPGNGTAFVDQITLRVFYQDANVIDSQVRLVVASALVGSNKADTVTQWPTTDTIKTYGGATDLWGTTLTPAQVNDSGFGLELLANKGNATGTAQVDVAQITVYYSTAPTAIATKIWADGADANAQQSRYIHVLAGNALHVIDPVTDTEVETTAFATTVSGGDAAYWAGRWWLALRGGAGDFVQEVQRTYNGTLGTLLRATDYTATALAAGPNALYRAFISGTNKALTKKTTSVDAFVQATSTLSITGTISNNDSINLDLRNATSTPAGYKFLTVLVNADGNVKIGATIKASMVNLINAINLNGGTPGTDYAAAETVHPTLVASQGVHVTATGTVDNTVSVVDAETVTVNGKVYTFQNVLTNVDGHVKIGIDTAHTIQNFVHAVNLSGGLAGTDYAAATTVNVDVTASAASLAAVACTLTAKTAIGADGNALTLATSSASLAVSGATLTGGITKVVFSAILGGAQGNGLVTTKNTMANATFSNASTAGGADTVGADANWSPSGGEQMGDPGIGIVRLAAIGDRFIAGKEDGIAEFDQDFAPRFYLDWMRAFRWSLQCQGILALGVSGDMIVTFRRGLWILPRNISIGVEQIPNNATDKVGRYTDVTFDGNWLYAALQNPASLNAHLIRMKMRSGPDASAAPGLFAHHPIVKRAASQFQALFVWPGCTVNGTTYGPRLYMAVDATNVGYIRLGETQPDQGDPNWRFTTGDWTVEWPQDDFGAPQTLKAPYRIECTAQGAEGTTGMRWQFRADSDDEWQDFTADGTPDGGAAITYDSFHRRYGPKDGSALARRWSLRIFGTGSLGTVQQRVIGSPILTIMEQPEQVREITTKFQLEAHQQNDDDAGEQWRKLNAASTGQILEMESIYVDDDGNDVAGRFSAYLDVKRSANVTSSEQPGVILVDATIRAMTFSDQGDQRDEEQDAD